MVIKLIDPDLPERKKRRWYKKHCPDFKKFFLSGCLSIVYNLYKRTHREIFYDLPENNDDIYEDQNEEIAMETEEKVNRSYKEGVYTYSNDIENNPALSRIIFKDYLDNLPDEEDLNELEVKEIIESVKNKLTNRNDSVGLIVFKNLIEENAKENSKDRNIAANFKIPIKEVRNAKKRVRRLAKQIIEENKNVKSNK